MDFLYEVDGNTYEFSIPGSGYLSLHDLVEALQVAEASGRDASEFMADVQSVSFSTPTLVWVGKVDADTTVAGLKAQNRLDCVPSAGLSQEQLDAIDATEVRAGDWAILSMAPFSSEESLTITMRTGEAFTVQVTDAQLSANVLTASGEKFVVTVTYGENAGIPDGARLVAEEVDSAPYMDRIEEALGSEWTTLDITATRSFDIAIISAEGEKVEPQAPVEVDIRLEDGIAFEEDDSAALVHFVDSDECELIEAETTLGSTTEEIGELTFVTESFSIYSFTTYSGNLQALDGKTFALVLDNPNNSNERHALQNVAHESVSGRLQALNVTVNSNNSSIEADTDIPTWTFEFVSGTNNQFYLKAANGPNAGKYLNISQDTNVNGGGLSLSDEPQALFVQSNNNGYRICVSSSNNSYNAVNDYDSGSLSAGFAVYQNNYGSTNNERFTLYQVEEYHLPATLFFVDRTGTTLPSTITIKYADGTPVTPVDSNDLSQGYVINPEKLVVGSDGTIDLSQFIVDGYTLSNTHRVTADDLTAYSSDSHTIVGNSFRLNNGNYQYEVFYSGTDTSGNGWFNLGMRPSSFSANGSHTAQADTNSNYYLVYSPNVTGAGGSGSGSGSGTDPTPDALATKKEFENNSDGTYDITLSVTGSAKQVQDSKNVNVVVVFDTSSSMVTHAESNTSTRTRLQASKEAIKSFASTLLENNTDADPERVQMALIDFNRDAYTRTFNGSYWTTSSTAFSSVIGTYTEPYHANDGGINGDGSIYHTWNNSGLGTLRGTNWAQALDDVIELNKPDDDPTYVLFFTDGAPSQYWDLNSSGDPMYYIDSMGNYLGARDEAREAVKDGRVELYGVFAYGSNSDETKDYLGKMVGYAYQNDSEAFVNEHRVYAQNTDQLEAELERILAKIQKDIGYKDVQVKDGITNLSSTSMVHGSLKNFNYAVTDNLGNNIVIYTDANSDGSVKVTGLAVNPARNASGDLENDITTVATTNEGAITYLPSGSDTTSTVAAGAATITYTTAVALDADSNPVLDGNGQPVYIITVTATSGGQEVGKWEVGTASYVSNSSTSAEIGPKSVTWKPVPTNDLLPDKWTYDLSFTVWPSQDAYDMIANLSNGAVKLTDQTDDVLIQLVVDVNGASYKYDVNTGKWFTSGSTDGITTAELQALVDAALTTATPATFYLKTNTKATVDYTPVTRINGVDTPGTPVAGAEIQDPLGQMVLDTNTMTVRKGFAHAINSANPYTRMCFFVTVDGKYYMKDGTTTTTKPSDADATDPNTLYYRIDLPKAQMPANPTDEQVAAYWDTSNWSDEVYIAPGLMRDNEVLETGHKYSLYEIVTTDNKYEYEFTPQVVRPMNIQATDTTFLIKQDDHNKPASGDSTYSFANAGQDDQYGSYASPAASGSDEVFYAHAGGENELVGTNRKTSELDITKKIDDTIGKMTEAQKDNETFTYRVKLEVPYDEDDPTGKDLDGITAYEYVPRTTDQYNGSSRIYIFGYQANDIYDNEGNLIVGKDSERTLGFSDDVTNLGGKIFGRYTVTTPGGGNTLKHVFVHNEETGMWEATIDITLRRIEALRFTNLPTGTHYTIDEVYANLRQANPSRNADATPSYDIPSNIVSQGYNITEYKTRSNGTETAATTGYHIEGTIAGQDTRYYNQFNNRITEEYAVLNLVAVKQLLGYNWSGERYFYSVEGQDGLFLPITVSQAFYISNSSGSDPRSYQYGTMRFTEPGEYKIKITEAPTTDDRYKVVNSETGVVTYYAIDGVEGYGEEKIITVTVEEQADGTLVVTSAVDDKGDTVLSTNPTTNQATVTTTFTNSVTTEVELLKIGDDNEEIKLSEVQFELYSDSACRNKITTDSMGNTLGTDGVVTTDPDGVASLGQLAAGTYYIKEIVTKDGYNLLNAPVELKLELQTEQSEGYKFKYVISGKIAQSDYKGGAPTDPNADGYFVINNTSGVELPMTGGMGTLPFTICGVALIVAAAGWLVASARYRRSER